MLMSPARKRDLFDGETFDNISLKKVLKDLKSAQGNL